MRLRTITAGGIYCLQISVKISANLPQVLWCSYPSWGNGYDSVTDTKGEASRRLPAPHWVITPSAHAWRNEVPWRSHLKAGWRERIGMTDAAIGHAGIVEADCYTGQPQPMSILYSRSQILLHGTLAATNRGEADSLPLLAYMCLAITAHIGVEIVCCHGTILDIIGQSPTQPQFSDCYGGCRSTSNGASTVTLPSCLLRRVCVLDYCKLL